MRYDLTINQFTKSIFCGEQLEVFDSNTWRPYCHVNDFSLALEKLLRQILNLQILKSSMLVEKTIIIQKSK